MMDDRRKRNEKSEESNRRRLDSGVVRLFVSASNSGADFITNTFAIRGPGGNHGRRGDRRRGRRINCGIFYQAGWPGRRLVGKTGDDRRQYRVGRLLCGQQHKDAGLSLIHICSASSIKKPQSPLIFSTRLSHRLISIIRPAPAAMALRYCCSLA